MFIIFSILKKNFSRQKVSNVNFFIINCCFLITKLIFYDLLNFKILIKLVKEIKNFLIIFLNPFITFKLIEFFRNLRLLFEL
jgi:hypothetical protein